MKDLSVIGVFIGLIVAILLIQPFIIYILWDDTFVKFFGVQDVTFVDSIFISIICSALFKSYKGD